ncbi:Spy/CpxP family protein refolding chaperone [Aliikangiella maris]|uniref:Spy/CpxP family protein refolding chaperone n=2 Tax=Aliikangiella maris TaxID=3162458 RepID=A0ABV2BXN5_9GAMM
MKIKALLMSLIIGFFSLSTMAGHPEHQGDRGNHRDMMFYKIMKKMDLTSEQKSQLKSIRAEYKPLMKENHEQVKAIKKQLKSLLKADVLDESAIRDVHAQMAQYKSNNLIIQTKMKRAMFQVLNEEQQKKFKQLKHKKHQHGQHSE